MKGLKKAKLKETVTAVLVGVGGMIANSQLSRRVGPMVSPENGPLAAAVVGNIALPLLVRKFLKKDHFAVAAAAGAGVTTVRAFAQRFNIGIGDLLEGDAGITMELTPSELRRVASTLRGTDLNPLSGTDLNPLSGGSSMRRQLGYAYV